MKISTWISAALLSLVLAGTSSAQSGMGMAFSRDILVGLFATGGLALNAGPVSDGVTMSSGFAFSAGGLGYLPVSEDMALSLGLAYDSRSVGSDVSIGGFSSSSTATYGFFSIRPGFKFKAIEVGLGLGLPLSASSTSGGQTESIATDSMAFLIEIRAGLGFPLIKNDNSELRLLVQRSYGITKLPKSADANTKNAGPLATAEIGVAYLFDISHSESY